ncbi:MAG TPA: AAA family ATPase, partial [Solirubrobacteraceae bacterium]|nr:AAA family ATPase [Solirubrobacteraceae bacterium]
MEPLLERDQELAVLEGLLDGLGEDRGAFVLVAGEAGIGKTSLMRALRARSDGRATFLTGACEPLSVPVPLGPLRELAEAAGGADPAALGTTDRLRLTQALLDALRARLPAVAVVEDAHWADPSTVDVLRLLARRAASLALLVVVTYRHDEVPANPALEQLIGDLATNPDVRRLALSPLSEAAVRSLAEPA